MTSAGASITRNTNRSRRRTGLHERFGSVGLLLRPAAADDRLTIAVSAARAARNPALEELFYFGPHPGNFAFEIGNPHLEAEHAFGFDVSLRWRSARASGEITYFRNDIRDFVFTAPVTAEDFVARETEFAERFPGRGIGEEPAEDSDEGEPLPIIEYLGADSVLQGIEAHADIAVTPTLFIELGVDYVRGTLKDTDEPLPRMPPLRARGGLRYQYNAFQAGGEVTAAATQNRIFSTETPTDNYQLLRLFASYTIGRGKAAHTITARLDNSTNERYRNHLSLIKDLVPEMGRNFKPGVPASRSSKPVYGTTSCPLGHRRCARSRQAHRPSAMPDRCRSTAGAT